MSDSITSNGISDFKLITQCGQLISNRLCCKDDIIASWVTLYPASDCSDNSNVGFISLTGEGSTATSVLQKDTSDHKFCFCSCNDLEDCEHYTLHFHRQCSDKLDDFSICLERFRTTVDAGSDQCILFGATATLGAGSDNPNTEYCWSGEHDDDFVSDKHILHTLVRPCKPGCNKYEVRAHDSEFPECRDFDCVDITVAEPIIVWSDVQQSDGGDTCTFSGILISSDTYTDKFHVILENCLTGSDILDLYVCTPYFFTQTVNKPVVPGATRYKLTAALSDFENCCESVAREHFLCVKSPVTLLEGPGILEILIRFFGFLLGFIFLGLLLRGNNQ